MSDDVRVPHFAFPFRFGSHGAAEVVEQDTPEEIEQNVKVLVLTERGERIEVPDFGVDDVVFQTGIDEGAIAAQAREWDERADVLIAEDPDRMNTMIRNVLIEVTEER